MYLTTLEANIMLKPLVRFRICTLLVGLACGLLLFLGDTGQASAQTAVGVVFINPPISSPEGDVHTMIRVSRPDGVPIANLPREAITVTEDSLPVNPAIAPDPDPSAIVLMIDASHNMFTTPPGAQKSPIEQAKEVAGNLVSNLQGKYEIALVTFNATETFVKKQDYTADPMNTLSSIGAIKDAPADEGSCLYDAIYRAEEDVNTRLRSAKAIIVITNNRDSRPGQSRCSSRSADDVVAKANEKSSNITLYFLGVSRAVDVTGLDDIAKHTNGKFALFDDAGQIDTTLKDLSQRLGGRYVVKYKSNATSGGIHQLRIEARLDNKTYSGETTFVRPIGGGDGPNLTSYVLFAIGIVAIVTLLLTLYMFLNRGRGGVTPPRKLVGVTKGPPVAEIIVDQAPRMTKQQKHSLYGDRSVSLGRDESQGIQLPGERLSRAHGEIIYRDNKFFYNDVKATNGTQVDGQAVHKGSPVPLHDGSEIIFGGQTLATFKLRPAGLAAATGNYQPLGAITKATNGPTQIPQAELHTTEWAPRETPLQDVRRDA
jgi:hypothetical protein